MFKNLLDKFRKDKLPPVLVPQLMDAYAREPVSFVRGEGLRLWDVDGTEYIDATSGGGSAILGHSHEVLSETISLQADKLLSIGNRFHSQEQADLAVKFCAKSGMDKVLFCTDHDSAGLAAMQIINTFVSHKGVKQAKVLAVGLTELPKAPLQIQPLAFDDINAVGEWADDDDVVAVVVPPLHCAAGIEFCDAGYLSALRDLCDEHSWLLVVDETLTGFGRCGTWFGFQRSDVVPDMIFGLSALGNGIPLGVCAARGELAETLSPGDYQSYFGGNPLACQVASSVIDVVEEHALIEKASQSGEALKRKLQQTIGTVAGVNDIRGSGLMLVVELESLPHDFVTRCLIAGLVIEVFNSGNAIRLMPAITISEHEADVIVERLHNVILDL